MKKEKTLMIRLDEEIFIKFKNLVDINRTTMSHEIRQYIIKAIKNDKK